MQMYTLRNKLLHDKCHIICNQDILGIKKCKKPENHFSISINICFIFLNVLCPLRGINAKTHLLVSI